MFSLRGNSGKPLTIPIISCNFDRFKNKFHIGINFNFFLEIYCKNPSQDLFRNIHSTSEIIETRIRKMREFNIEPIFVFNGLKDTLDSYVINHLNYIAIDLFKKLNVKYMFAISYVNPQLAEMQRRGVINAILTDYSLALSDIGKWIYFIDFDLKRFLVLSANKEFLKEIINENTLDEIKAPYIGNNKLKWSFLPIFDGENMSLIPKVPLNILTLMKLGLLRMPTLIKEVMNSKISSNYLGKNYISYFKRNNITYLTLFQYMTNLSFNKFLALNNDIQIDEFLPFLLNQIQFSTDLPLCHPSGNTENQLFFNILSQYNISTNEFTTLYEYLDSLSMKENPKEDEITNEFIVKESIKKFLISYEYIAPGGGLSPWGRSFLFANSKIEIPTILFIELTRAEIIDIGENSSAGIIDIIERTFSLFPMKTKFPDEIFQNSGSISFNLSLNLILSQVNSFIGLLLCDNYLRYSNSPSLTELRSLIDSSPFLSFKQCKSGSFMKFLLESSEATVLDFIKQYNLPIGQLKEDVENAFEWWSNLKRATFELKQRSLRPNSRVSNLKNFLLLFECANEFVEKRSEKVLKYL